MTDRVESQIDDPAHDRMTTVYPWNKKLWQQLFSSVAADLPQAIMLSGSVGIGKRQFATQFSAQVLNNDDVFYHGNHPDLHVIKAEDELKEGHLLSEYARRYIATNSSSTKAKPKTVITVQQIRDLIHQATQYPQLAERKVILIDAAEKMNANAANALLKTLEEPTSNTNFLLVTDHLQRIPVTIRSRCVIFKMQAPSYELGLEWLNTQSTHTHLASYLSMASRAPLQALQLAEKDYIAQIRDIFTQLNLMWSRKQTSVQTAKTWAEWPLEQVVDCLQKLLFDAIKLSALNAQSNDVKIDSLYFPVQQDWIEKIANRVESSRLFALINIISDRKKLLNTPLDSKLALEELAISFDNLL